MNPAHSLIHTARRSDSRSFVRASGQSNKSPVFSSHTQPRKEDWWWKSYQTLSIVVFIQAALKQKKTSLQDKPNTPLQSWRSSSDRSSKVWRSESSGCIAPTLLLTFLSCLVPAESLFQLPTPASVARIIPEKYVHYKIPAWTEHVKKGKTDHQVILGSGRLHRCECVLSSPPQSPAEWTLLCPHGSGEPLSRVCHTVAPP